MSTNKSLERSAKCLQYFCQKFIYIMYLCTAIDFCFLVEILTELSDN